MHDEVLARLMEHKQLYSHVECLDPPASDIPSGSCEVQEEALTHGSAFLTNLLQYVARYFHDLARRIISRFGDVNAYALALYEHALPTGSDHRGQ